METNTLPETPFVNKTYQLNRFNGKPGWMFATITGINEDKFDSLGWVNVKGSINGYEFRNFHLKSLWDGTIYFPLSQEICHLIRKTEGDWVRIILYEDKSQIEIPHEFLLKLKNNPLAYQTFQYLSESLQKGIIDWIYSSNNNELRIERIDKAIRKLTR